MQNSCTVCLHKGLRYGFVNALQTATLRQAVRSAACSPSFGIESVFMGATRAFPNKKEPTNKTC